jgi:transposase
MRKTYPSDITREQFEKILSILASARKKTKPRTLDLYEVFNAALYVLKTGCQWSALPHEYPKYKTVHSYFMKWSEEKRVERKKQQSVLEQVLKKIGRGGAYTRWKKTLHEHGHR